MLAVALREQSGDEKSHDASHCSIVAGAHAATTASVVAGRRFLVGIWGPEGTVGEWASGSISIGELR